MLLDGTIPAVTPKCACPVLTEMLQAFREGLGENIVAELPVYVARLAGTKAPAEQERARVVAGVEYSVRTFLPRALATVPDLQHLATSLSSLPTLADESHAEYVQAVADLATAIRTHVTQDPLARGASAMKAVYQVQYLLEKYRIRPHRLVAQVMTSAFSRIKGDTSALLLLDELFTAG